MLHCNLGMDDELHRELKQIFTPCFSICRKRVSLASVVVQRGFIDAKMVVFVAIAVFYVGFTQELLEYAVVLNEGRSNCYLQYFQLSSRTRVYTTLEVCLFKAFKQIKNFK